MADNPLRDAVASVGRSDPVMRVGQALEYIGDRAEKAYDTVRSTATDYYRRFTQSTPTRDPKPRKQSSRQTKSGR